MTKIIIEDEFGKYEIEDKRNGLNINEMIDLFIRALLAVSYHPKTIENGIIEKAEEYENE